MLRIQYNMRNQKFNQQRNQIAYEIFVVSADCAQIIRMLFYCIMNDYDFVKILFTMLICALFLRLLMYASTACAELP